MTITSPFPQITTPPQALAEVLINEIGETLKHTSVYGKDQSSTSGLIWGYYGGRWGGFSVSGSTFTLTASNTNYIVVAVATGVTTCGTSSTNWNNATDYVRVYKLTTSGSAVTAEEDHRSGPGGINGAVAAISAAASKLIGRGSAGGSGAVQEITLGSGLTMTGTTLSASGSAGRHSIPIIAASIRPSVTGGCAAQAIITSASNQPDIASLDFDPTTQEYAQFSIPMPKSWDEGTITFKPIWSHASTATNFGVVWDLQAVAVSDADGLAAAYGTSQTSTDTGGTTNAMYVGPESSAITIAGSPAAEDVVMFRISRVTANGSDTMAIDARLMGVILYITTDTGTDA